jgi:hypothetical protein
MTGLSEHVLKKLGKRKNQQARMRILKQQPEPMKSREQA